MRRLGRLLMAVCLFLAAAGSSQAQQACSLVQITTTVPSGGPQISSSFPAIDASGNRIAFSSNADLIGQNDDRSHEIFLWDAATGLTQITHTDIQTPTVPVINAAGNRIAFSSRLDFVGSNGDGSLEIFLWDAATGFIQITNTRNEESHLPRLNADGTRLAFSSNANFVGNNGDRNYEIFLWDASTGFTQITNTTGDGSYAPFINAAGNRIAFASDADPLDSNIDHNPEIFLWDASAGLTQITDTVSYGSSQPSFNAAGDQIVFQSTHDLAGNNGDRRSEVFLWNAATGFTQLTAFPATSGLFSPLSNSAGNRIAFFAVETNAGVFLWDATTGVSRILDGHSAYSSINAAGNRIAFSSDANPLGSNGDGNTEIFLATCPEGAPLEASIPTVSSLGLTALAVLLGLAAAWTLRRRRVLP